MLMDSHVKIVHGFFVFFVYNDFNVFLRDFSFLNVFVDEFSSLVRRAVVNVNNVVIVVILHKHGVKISEVKPTLDIVVRRSNNTERKLFFTIKIDIIFFVVILFI